MTGAHPVDPEQYRSHAANLEAVRSLIEEVRVASRRAAWDRDAFGPLCGSILTCFDTRYVRDQEDLAYLEETLAMLVDGLRNVADGELELKTLIRRDDDMTTIDGTPVIDEPPHSISGLMESMLSYIDDMEWVEPQLANAPVAEFAAPIDDRYAALRAAGLDCAMTCVDPLRRMIDDLAVAPEVIAERVVLWSAIGADLRELSIFLHQCVAEDLPRRDRQDIRSYQAMMAYNVDGLVGLSERAMSVAVVMRFARDLILLTRDIVRGIIGDLFARVIDWIVDMTTPVSASVMARQLGIVVGTAWRIDAYIAALTTSVTTLSHTIDD
jgi:hypothetical protein